MLFQPEWSNCCAVHSAASHWALNGSAAPNTVDPYGEHCTYGTFVVSLVVAQAAGSRMTQLPSYFVFSRIALFT